MRSSSSTYRRVVLSGFMGAGKSTVGPLAAGLLGWLFLDADQVLVERARMPVGELFAVHGEAAFRREEALVVQGLLAREHVVIALGGGALEHGATRDRLQADPATLVVFLDTPLAVSVERCQAEPGAADRPVLRDRQALEARFLGRLEFYRATAGLTLSTAGQQPGRLAQWIADALRDAPAETS